MLSALMSLNYDEGYWLAIARMVGSGRVLYETAIDNKSPVVYLAVWLIDILPGPFILARALVVGLIAFVLSRLVARSAMPHRASPILTVLIPIACVMFGAFHLQTELLASPLVALGLMASVNGHALKGGLLAVAATCITPLAAMTIPLAIVLSRRRASRRSWIQGSATTVTITIAILLVVLVTPELRYGLIELNLASRVPLGTDPLPIHTRVALVLTSLLPLLAIGWLNRWRTYEILALGTLAVPAIVAVLGLPHYWIVVVAGSAAFIRRRHSPTSTIPWGVAVMSLVPLAILVAGSVSADRQIVDRYENVAATLRDLPSDEWTFATFDLQPHLSVHFPERTVLRSPSVNYLAWNTSRTDEHRAELGKILSEVDVLVDPGLSQGLQPGSGIAPIAPLFERHLDGFSCTRRVEGLEIHLRRHLCAP